jgi:hypothetical protein
MRTPTQRSDPRAITRLRGRARRLEHRIVAPKEIVVVFDGLGAPLTAGIKGDVAIHFDGLIIRWRLLADQPGNLVVDIWKATYASYPPLVADSITAADLPTLSAAEKAEDTALTGWTTGVNDGDTLRFHIDSAATVTRATLTLTLIA